MRSRPRKPWGGTCRPRSPPSPENGASSNPRPPSRSCPRRPWGRPAGPQGPHRPRRRPQWRGYTHRRPA
eukprot:13827509-Alexandrium_andersonii.AAC.1